MHCISAAASRFTQWIAPLEDASVAVATVCLAIVAIRQGPAVKLQAEVARAQLQRWRKEERRVELVKLVERDELMARSGSWDYPLLQRETASSNLKEIETPERGVRS